MTVSGLLSSWHEQFVCVLVCRWGRFQESISEDPWLLGAYSSTFLTKFQAADSSGTPATISSCKHLVAYSLEGGDSAGWDNLRRWSSCRGWTRLQLCRNPSVQPLSRR
eukprot:COSAG01_NODE_6103_length_3849_cov_7.994400_1_plen_107_part_10